MSRRGVDRAGVRELASFERASASAGERRAAEWLAGELRAAGCRDVRVEEERAHGGYWWPLGLLNAGVARWPRCSGRRARGAGGRPRGGRRLRRRERRQALVSPPRAAAPPDLERGRRARATRTRRGRSCSSPTTTPPTAASCSTRRCRGSACGSCRSCTSGRTRASRSSSASSSARCCWRSGACSGRRPLRAGRHSSSPPAPRPRWRTSARSRVVPGANDNLSAVGALVALAHELRERPARGGARASSLSTGSEESLHGGDAGVRPPPLRRARPRERPSSSASSASARRSCAWSRREGMLRMRHYTDALTRGARARRARRPACELRRGLRTVAATDALIALRAGYPTCTLGGVDDTKFPSNYHWPSDMPDNLDWSSIEGAVEVCLRYVRELAAGSAGRRRARRTPAGRGCPRGCATSRSCPPWRRSARA